MKKIVLLSVAILCTNMIAFASVVELEKNNSKERVQEFSKKEDGKNSFDHKASLGQENNEDKNNNVKSSKKSVDCLGVRTIGYY